MPAAALQHPSAAPDKAALQVTFVTVDEDSAGQRLDNFLIRQLKGVPKTHVYRIIRSGEVRINKGRVQADTRIAAGDVLRLPPVRTSERAGQKAEAMAVESARHGAASTTGGYAPSREFPILFEDDHALGIDKPAGVAVHGGSGVAFGVIEQLRMARPDAHFLELVHRLDRETSGILLVAKKRVALKNLQEQFRERETDKIYLAMVKGAWPANKKVLDKPLQKYLLADGERRVQVVGKEHPDGMRAVTLIKVKGVAPDGSFSLLEVTLKTGRTHQIRVHLASEGHPIAGDDKYGDFELNKTLQKEASGATLKRMFLHAWRLKFTHPSSGKRIELLAALPPDLESFTTHAVSLQATDL
ncbi:MAG: RluA family pseudouridine synthase [Polaromonas sp.]|nr:RluA family pseudouridine synthase [Polaromonas sp.]MDP2818805.1 RluA family pseudouridine synthase [Polaromonas sp.]